MPEFDRFCLQTQQRQRRSVVRFGVACTVQMGITVCIHTSGQVSQWGPVCTSQNNVATFLPVFERVAYKFSTGLDGCLFFFPLFSLLFRLWSIYIRTVVRCIYAVRIVVPSWWADLGGIALCLSLWVWGRFSMVFGECKIFSIPAFPTCCISGSSLVSSMQLISHFYPAGRSLSFN